MERAKFDVLLTGLVDDHNYLLRTIDSLKHERDWLREELQAMDWVPKEEPLVLCFEEGVQAATASSGIGSNGHRHHVIPAASPRGGGGPNTPARSSVVFAEQAETVDVDVDFFDLPPDLGRVRSRSAQLIIGRDSSQSAMLGPVASTTAETPKSSRSLFDHQDAVPQLHRVWLQHDMAAASCRSLPASRASQRKLSSGSWKRRNSLARTGDVVVDQEGTCAQWLVMRPSSYRRLVWDILSTIVVLYDLVSIPMEAFRTDLTMYTILLDWITTFFWSCDMVCSALSGYHSEGVVEMRPRYTMRHYIRTSFPLDCFALISDILMLGLAMRAGFDAFGVLRMNKTVRLVRVLRIIRITRLTKVQHVLGSMYDRIHSESFKAVLSIGLLLFVIVLVNHYIACVWYLLGDTNPMEYNLDWVTEHKSRAPENAGLWYWYSTSLHWSLTQFTPAGMEVHAVNQVERIYSVFVLLFALVTFSSFVSSITGAMTRLRQLQQSAVTQQAVLRRFFLQNKISADLGQGIFDYLAHNRKNDKTKLREEEVTALKLLPQNLLGKVHEELYMPWLLKVPIFELYSNVFTQGLQGVCHEAMTTRSIMVGEYAFVEGKPGDKMYIITAGALEYTLRTRLESMSNSLPQLNRQSTVLRRAFTESTWIAEPSIWLTWMHSGRLLAMDVSEVVEVSSHALQSVIASPYNAFGRDVLQTYAQLYADRFLKLDPSERTDLCFDYFATSQLVRATEEIVDPGDAEGSISSPRMSVASDCPASPSSQRSRLSQPRRFFGFGRS